jgi:hypothetical protein
MVRRATKDKIMDINHGAGAAPAPTHPRKHVEQLLGRYPAIDPGEAAEILRFLKTAQPLELGLLTSNEAIRPQLERFRIDHARELSLGWKGLLVAFAIIALLALIAALLWDAGTG